MGKNGYRPLISDNAVYYSEQAGIIVASYVDDFLLFGPDRNNLQALTKTLNDEVALNDLGSAEWFLGVRIRRTSPTGSVQLDQHQYLERSLQEFSIETRTNVSTPLSTSSKIDMRRYIFVLYDQVRHFTSYLTNGTIHV